MASAAIALIGSITAGFTTPSGPPNLAILLHRTPNITHYSTLLSSYPYRPLSTNMSFPKSQGLVTILIPNDDAFTPEHLPEFLGKAFERNDTGVIGEVMRYQVLRGVHAVGGLRNGSFEVLGTWGGWVGSGSGRGGGEAGMGVRGMQREEVGGAFGSGVGGEAGVVRGDLYFNAGVVHIIDTFLTPPLPLVPTLSAANLTSFASALNQTSLSSSLTSRKDITIFAPSDAAFNALGSIHDGKLSQLLQHHIINGTYGLHGSKPFAKTIGYNSSLINGSVWQTLSGGNVGISRVGDEMFVNGVKVVREDVLMEGGVVHVLDSVFGDGDLGSGIVARAGIVGRSGGGGEGDGGVVGARAGASGGGGGSASASSSHPITLVAGAAVEFSTEFAFGHAFGVLSMWFLWMVWWA